MVDQKGHQQWSPLDGSQSRKLLHEMCQEDNLLTLMMTKKDGSYEASQLEMEHRLRSHASLYSILTNLMYTQNFLMSAEPRTAEDVEVFERHARTLYSNFVDLDKKNATKWYLHMLVCHIGTQLRQEKSIASFTCSSQERVNSQHYRMLQTCVQYHCSSLQLLEMKRLECMYEFNLTKYCEQKRNYPQNRRRAMQTGKNAGRRKSMVLSEGEDRQGGLQKSKKRVFPIT